MAIFLGNKEISNVFIGDIPIEKYFQQAPAVTVRNDAFGSFVKLAMPGTLFPTLGMSNFYGDISSLIVGSGNNVSLVPTGSGTGLATPYLYPTASVVTYSTYNFANDGYQTSVFTSGSQNVGVASTSVLNFSSSSFVVEGWFNRKSAKASPPFNMFFFGETSGNYILMDFNNQLRFYINGSGLITPAIGPSPENQWFHFAFVRSGTTRNIYVDGDRKATDTFGSAAVDNPPSSIWSVEGVNDGTTSNGIAKQIQDFRITIGSDRNYTGSAIPVPQSIVTYQ
jgi:hypothetical protein